jgi:hypothetical protein
LTSKSESLKKRLLIAFAFFVLLPIAYQFITDLLGIESNRKQIAQTTVEASPTPTQLTCFDIRQERTRLKEVADTERNTALKQIPAIQKDRLIQQLQSLYENKFVTQSQWNSIQSLQALVNSEDLPVSPLVTEYIAVNKTLEYLLDKKLIKPYFDSDVIVLGEKLASSSNPELLYVIDNSKCFESWDVDLAKSLSNLSVKSAWDDKKTAADFVQVLTWRNR